MAERVAYEAFRSRNKVLREVKVADIVFSFKNNKLIERLKLRGEHIVNQNWKKFGSEEAKI